MRGLASVPQPTRAHLETSPPDDRPSSSDVRALAQPHLAILVHKRAKASAADGTLALSDKQWESELNKLAGSRVDLAANEAERVRLIKALDQVIEAEQHRLTARSAAIPMTSRFDTNWAI